MTGNPRTERVDEDVVLVTVFGAFPGQDVNPTEDIADALAGQDHVVSHVLDVSYERSIQQLDDLVQMVAPMAVVSFGVAADAHGIRLEELARNRGGAATPDVDGAQGPPGPLDDGPESLPTRLPLPAIADALVAAGIPVEPSDDAGKYVCNHIFRRLVTHPVLADIPVGFVHVPDPARGLTTIDIETIRLAGRIVVDTVAAHARGDL